MFTTEEIKIANSTYRSKGSSVFDKDGSVRSVVAKFVANNVQKDKKILDFGCGPKFVQGKYLNDMGFNVEGWDFGGNKPENCVAKLEPVYDVVYASNVLNVISSVPMLIETLDQIYNCLKENGIFIANYPQSPRKMSLSEHEMMCIIKGKFNRMQYASTSSVWVFTRINVNEKRLKVGA